MALGYVPYKSPNAIYTITEDLTGREGSGVVLSAQGVVSIASDPSFPPYGIVTVGGPSNEHEYPGLIGGSSVEFVDQLGCVVQVKVSSTGSVNVGDFLLVDAQDTDGTFVSAANQSPEIGHWLWGMALTSAAPGEQCMMRFQTQFYFGTFLGP